MKDTIITEHKSNWFKSRARITFLGKDVIEIIKEGIVIKDGEWERIRVFYITKTEIEACNKLLKIEKI